MKKISVGTSINTGNYVGPHTNYVGSSNINFILSTFTYMFAYKLSY